MEKEVAMIYAIREANGRKTLVEFSSRQDLREAQDSAVVTYVASERAHRWVRDGLEHETGLWLDNGKLRYAKPADRES